MALTEFLNHLQDKYHRTELLSSDPIEIVHRYSDPHDQEVVALVSAVMAYGNVKQIRRSIETILSLMEQLADTPASFVRGMDGAEFQKRTQSVFHGFRYRFNVGSDFVLLLSLLHESWKQYGSLGGHFLSHFDPQADTVEVALSALIADWRGWTGARRTESFDYLLTSPADGSCCKRWCMLLRWMVRKDEIDLGLWGEQSPWRNRFAAEKFVHPRHLVIPLDTHTGRISQYLGLTQRKSLNWKAALEVTENLKKSDSKDPTRYDFALSRLGILDVCQKKYREEICRGCELVTVCQFAKKKMKLRARVKP